MLHVHDLVDEYEHRLVARWTTTALEQGALGVDETAHARIASFLKGLRLGLATAASENVASPWREDGSEIEDGQRPSAFHPMVAARAFAALHALLLELASERQVSLSSAEQLTLASYVHAAIGKAIDVGSKQHERDTWKAAHELRNPLGSAMMALTMLRSRADLGKDARLADTLERNLKRLQAIIEEWTARAGKPVVASESSSIVEG